MMQVVRLNINYFRLLFIIVSLFSSKHSTAQEITVVSKLKIYQSQVKTDSLQTMASLRDFLPSAILDLRYATRQNFTGKKLYSKGNQTFVRIAVAHALKKVQEELGVQGYTLKIWDAYRPYSVTKKMWELIGDERYVANPAKGSGHNRGLAIDLTLLKNGKEINMGTGFDNFTDTAHHDFKNLPDDVLQNRKLLKTTMEKHGFRALDTEWWHYSWPNNRNYDVMDLSFKDLRKKDH
ncbi:MAG: peptidase M15 [Chitinophagaceae bacterium]|nr:MAG: peptidase M15 [Chitinophagaceae bacterium]